MRKKVVYLGAGFVILGTILVVMGLVMLTETGIYQLSGNNYDTFRTLLNVRSVMNWLGIIFSIGGAVAIIVGIYLDEQVQFEKANSTSKQSIEKQFVAVEPSQKSDKADYCFQCGEKLEGNPNYCFRCGTKLRR